MALKGRQGPPKPLPGQHGGSLVRGAEVLPGFRRQEPCTGAVSPEGMDMGVGAGSAVPKPPVGLSRTKSVLPAQEELCTNSNGELGK